VIEITAGATTAQSNAGTLGADGNWHHVAIIRSSGAGMMATVSVYCDGVQAASAQALSLSPGAATVMLSTNSNVSLTVDEFRLSDGVIYNGAFTPPDEPFAYIPKPPPGALLTISLESVREGLTSLQRHEWTMSLL